MSFINNEEQSGITHEDLFLPIVFINQQIILEPFYQFWKTPVVDLP